MTRHRYNPWPDLHAEPELTVVRCVECERDVPAVTASSEGFCQRCQATYWKRYIRTVPEDPIEYSEGYRRFVRRILAEIELGL